jgi:hypothetical protein
MMRRNASILNHLVMKRNAQIILNWKQLHHEMLKLRKYVEWWDAAMKWKIERVSDHVTQHHLIFICTKRLDFLHMRRFDFDQSLWDRFVSSICWFRNEVVFQLSDKLIFWFYEDDREIKHLRHDRTKMIDESSIHDMIESKIIEHEELWMKQLNLHENEDLGLRWTSIDELIDEIIDGLIDRILRVGNFLYNEVDFPPRFSRQQ